jgi:hypothetical protein
MSLLGGLRHRFRVLTRRQRYADEIAREDRFHSELESLAQSPNGVATPDIESVARKTFGKSQWSGAVSCHRRCDYGHGGPGGK